MEMFPTSSALNMACGRVPDKVSYTREGLITKGARKSQKRIGMSLRRVPPQVFFPREGLITKRARKSQKRFGVKLKVVPLQTSCTRKCFVAKMTQHPTAMNQPYYIYYI